MPLHGHQHSSSASGRYENRSDQGTGIAGIYQPTQPLASINTPAGSLRISTSHTTSVDAGTSPAVGGNFYGGGSEGQSTTVTTGGLTNSQTNSSAMPPSVPSNSSHNFDTPRRTHAFARQPDELHIPSNHVAMGQQNSREQSRQNSYHLYDDSARGIAMQGQQQSNSSTGRSLPGALQPGNSGRPGPLSANTAPSTVPTLPHISTQTQPYSNSSRVTSVSHSHSYSRSSPAGLDQQKYLPYVNTPEEPDFASTPGHRYTASQTPQGTQGAPAYSPLGLADIRPRAGSGQSEGPPSANPYSAEGHSANPTNCNYLAPWAVYAFDWCKWPVQKQGLGDAAGKMAIGSYLEDGHNFVSITMALMEYTLTVSFINLNIDTNLGDSDRSRSRD